jgi:phosphoglycolate phosphatase
MANPALVIFDCDGTLVDSQGIIVAAMTRAFETHGRAPLPRQQVLSIVGLSLPEAITKLLPDADPPTVAAVVTTFKASFNQFRRDPAHNEPLYPGILEILDELSERPDISLGIATGKSTRGMLALLDRLDLRLAFATVQTADTNPSKPSPVMLERALAEAGFDARNAVMIGDTVYDIDMAAAAGVASIGVGWGYHGVTDLEAAGAHELVHDARDLIAAIERVLARHRG